MEISWKISNMRKSLRSHIQYTGTKSNLLNQGKRYLLVEVFYSTEQSNHAASSSSQTREIRSTIGFDHSRRYKSKQMMSIFMGDTESKYKDAVERQNLERRVSRALFLPCRKAVGNTIKANPPLPLPLTMHPSVHLLLTSYRKESGKECFWVLCF